MNYHPKFIKFPWKRIEITLKYRGFMTWDVPLGKPVMYHVTLYEALNLFENLFTLVLGFVAFVTSFYKIQFLPVFLTSLT
jgi:hypothetical protein